MAYPNEQLGSPNIYKATRRTRRHIKRSTSKHRRRLAKKLLDDAPKKTVYRGYYW